MAEGSWRPLVQWEHRDGTAAVCRDEGDGSLWLTGEAEDGGMMLEGFEPGLEEGDEQTIVGGKLPAGATAAHVVDRAGDVHGATVGEGAWLIVLNGHAGWWEPIVLFRDASGEIVPRPRAKGARVERLPGALSECPACNGRDWERVTYWPDLGLDAPAGDEVKALRCCRCGHEESPQTAYASLSVEAAPGKPSPFDDEHLGSMEQSLGGLGVELPDEVRSALQSEDPDQLRRGTDELARLFQRGVRGEMSSAAAAAEFPLYGLGASWLGARDVTSWGGDPEAGIEHVTVRHTSDQDDTLWVDVDTALITEDDEDEDGLWPSLSERAEEALEDALDEPAISARPREHDEPVEGAYAGDALKTLRYAKEGREREAQIARAPRRNVDVVVGGEPVGFLVIGGESIWGASARIDRLVITMAGHRRPIEDLTLEPIDPTSIR